MSAKKEFKRKVYLLGPAYPYRGGLAAFNEQLARALQKAGYEVRLITFSLQYPDFLFPGKTQYVEGPPPEDLQIERWINTINPISWLQTGLRIRKAQPALVIAAYWLPLMGPALGTILRLAGATHRIGLIHNLIPHEKRPGDRLFSRYFVGSADSFITLSRQVKEDTERLTKNKETVFSPHPIYDHYGELQEQAEARQKLGLEQNGRYLLFFGFIRAYKGLDLLLEALADERLKEMKVQLVVAGEFYQNEEEYRTQIEQLGIADRLILRTDFIPDEEVGNYFSAADLVVQPYKTATQSGISQIAYHFERPMIVTKVGGLPEIVPDGEAGYVVEPQPTAIADAVVDFFQNERAEGLRKGVRQGKARFSWAELVKVMEGLDERWRRRVVKNAGEDASLH